MPKWAVCNKQDVIIGLYETKREASEAAKKSQYIIRITNKEKKK